MKEEKTVSIFDSDLQTVQITRSNARRHAMVIPQKKSFEFANKIKKQMENVMDIEEPITNSQFRKA